MTIDLTGPRKYIALGVLLLLGVALALGVTVKPAAGSGQQVADSGQRVADSGQQSVVSGQPLAESRKQADREAGAVSREPGADSLPSSVSGLPSSVPGLPSSPPPAGLPFDPGNAPVYVTCRFRDPNQPQHSGLDFPVDEMTEILSTMTGTVTFAGYDALYGNLVIVENEQWETHYAHNAYLLARTGDTVQPGDLLALAGSSGSSSGPHLHYEVRDALDVARNPEAFLGSTELQFSECKK